MSRPEDLDEAPAEFELSAPAPPIPGLAAIAENPFAEIPEETPLDAGGEPGTDPSLEFRKTLGMFATGVTIVTSAVGDQVHGMTANAFMSVSLRPPLILVSIDRRAKMNRILRVGATYGVSVLADSQRELSDRFAGRASEGGPEPSFVSVRDTPLVAGAMAHLVARVVRTYWGGDHALFLGQVEYARYGEGRPLLFHGGGYAQLPVADLPLFAALDPEVRERIMSAAVERAFEPGETVLRAGDDGDELFVVIEGGARVERSGRVVFRLAEGDFFGEIAVLDGGPRSADVIADTPLRCLVVPRDALRRTISEDPDLAWYLLEVLAGRLRQT